MNFFFKSFKYAIILIIGIALYWLSRYNYLHFHLIAEFYSIIIAGGIFIVSWNTRKNTEYNSLVFLGLCYFFIAIIDFYHTISYNGMNIFNDYNFYANQLWVVARVLESFSILIFSLLKNKFDKKYYIYTILILIFYTLINFLFIFYWKTFPECFIQGKGQTIFKIYIEYFICFVLLTSCAIIINKRKKYDFVLFKQIILSIILTIFSEVAFTLYTDNYGITNVIGHLLKILSFYSIYLSIIVNTLERPIKIIYNDLNNANIKISKQKKELETIVNELKIANNTKNKFFGIIAHDLKSPFNPILGFTEILENLFLKQKGGTKQLEYIKHIKNSAEKGFKLLNNLLDWAQIQTGEIKFNPEKNNIKDIIYEVISLTEEQAKIKNINIICEIKNSEILYIDYNMIYATIRNLISNAIKFTNKNGEIKVKLLKEENKIILLIIDNGVGISNEHIEKIFDVSSKYSTLGTNGESGTGLGLILCKEFVEINKGKIEIKSKINQGTEIKIVFPATD
ncbi:hypothetical protein KA977_13310 [Candidatus Dependentiae bacterium]|nr:hypothetical protein [Candidatus Dependentiae bacterium]